MASPSNNISSSIPPRPGSGPGTEIDPQLENVLRNLNVNLEDELTRYRRQRHGRVPPPPPPRRAAQRKTIDLISVSASSEPTPGALNQPPTPPPPPPNPFLNKSSESEDEPFDADMVQLTDIAEDEPIAGLDEAVQYNAEADEIDSSALPVPSNDMPADGYLESSEELLKSLEEEQTDPASVPEPYSPDRKNNGLLKLAGLVLVLIGGIGAGFAITSASQLQKLRSQLWPAGDVADTESNTPETNQVEGGGDATPSEPAAASPETVPDDYTPPGPDLSTREFKNLDNVKDLVTLEIDGVNSPTNSPAPAPASTNPGTAAVPSTLPTNPAQSPLPPATAPASQATNPTTAPPTDSPPSNAPAVTNPATAVPSAAPTVATGSNFYVIASYTGDASLSKARELVPDAFVRNFKAGTRIQLAAFDNRAQAEEQVAFLTQQGAIVELFGPTNE